MLSLNESLSANIDKWNDEIKFLRVNFNFFIKKNIYSLFSKNQLQNLNQSSKIQELVLHFQELNNLVHNSSDKVEDFFLK